VNAEQAGEREQRLACDAGRQRSHVRRDRQLGTPPVTVTRDVAVEPAGGTGIGRDIVVGPV
jgi:hypothetical protein